MDYKPQLEIHKTKKDKKMHWMHILPNVQKLWSVDCWWKVIMINNSVWWFKNVSYVLWCSVMLVFLSAGDCQQQQQRLWGNHQAHELSSLSRSSSALQTFITPVCRCKTRMTKLKSQVHEANRPFAEVIKKKEDYIACHSVMVSLRFFTFLQSLIAV